MLINFKLRPPPRKFLWIYTSPLPPRQTLQSYSFIGWCQKEHAIFKSIFSVMHYHFWHTLIDRCSVKVMGGVGDWMGGLNGNWVDTEKHASHKCLKHLSFMPLWRWHAFCYITVLISHLSIVGINRGWQDLTSAVNSKKINGINRG